MEALLRAGLLAGVCGGILSACETPAPPGPEPEPLEPVLTWYVEDDALFVRAFSGGCTNKSSFEPHVYMEPGEWVAEVELERTEPDLCEAFMPNGALISWSREELAIPGSAEIELVNPVRARIRGS